MEQSIGLDAAETEERSMSDRTADYSLADFFFSDTSDPLVPPADYVTWRQATSWATSLYEPHLLGPAGPRVRIDRGGAVRSVINLSSYNYMGFAEDPDVIRAAQEALGRYGTGACGSPLLSGMTDLHQRLEERLSAFMQRPATMLFNSGFGGAMGALAGLLRKGDVAILDAKCHLCLIAGPNLARARSVFFDHNDPRSLDEALTSTAGKRRIVVVEGIYSMDGDMANLPALLEVTEKHGVGIFIDEAHSILACGAHGRGVTEHFGVEDRVALVFATFSKSFASVGGFVSGSADTINYLRYYSHPYGFSCALPPSVVAGLLEALELGTRDDERRNRLRENTRYFRQRLLDLGLNLGESTTHVVPIVIGSDRQALYELGHEMQEKGLFLAPVDYPSVPEDGLRYRAAVTAAHTRQDLDEAIQIIEDTIVRRLFPDRVRPAAAIPAAIPVAPVVPAPPPAPARDGWRARVDDLVQLSGAVTEQVTGLARQAAQRIWKR
jgi:glycine C-acetyltransferase